MKINNRIRVPAIAALAAVLGQPALAEEPSVEELTKPRSEIGVGLGAVGGEPRQTGMYTGMNEGGLYPLLNADIVNRDNDTGTWLRFLGRNIGLDNRSMRLEYERQGSWNSFIDYSQTPKFNPLIITGRTKGIGSGTNWVTSDRQELDLHTERYNGKVGFGTKFGDGFEAKASYRQEHKTGARQWNGISNVFLAEPIDYKLEEVDGTLAYADKRLQIQANYLGSFFRNDFEALNGSGDGHATDNSTAYALPPDNQAHKVDLSGGYNFTPVTRATFKLAYWEALQNENFFQPSLINGRTSLDGDVVNTLAQLGLSTKPLQALSVNVKLRWQDRDDQTPRLPYIAPGGSASGFNSVQSRTTNSGDLELAYQLPDDYKLIASAGYEKWQRNHPSQRSVGYRRETEEGTYRLELRRAMTEDLTGSVAAVHAERTGSEYLYASTNNVVDSIHWASRQRDKGRISVDWSPTDKLSTQALAEYGKDTYPGRKLGPQEGHYGFASLDTTYKLDKEWDITAYGSYEDTRIRQQTRQAQVSSGVNPQDWEATLRSFGSAVGVGLRGKPRDDFKIGVNIQQTWDTTQQDQRSLDNLFVPTIPDIDYRQFKLSAFIDHEYVKDSGIRLDYQFTHIDANDWTWKNWAYTDNGDFTTVSIPEQQDVHFVGLTYYHRW